MILCDVSVLLNAFFANAEHHRVCRAALDGLRRPGEQFALMDQILSGVLRIATNPRVFKPAPAAAEVFAFLNALRDDENAVILASGPRHWRIFQDLVEGMRVRGGD